MIQQMTVVVVWFSIRYTVFISVVVAQKDVIVFSHEKVLHLEPMSSGTSYDM